MPILAAIGIVAIPHLTPRAIKWTSLVALTIPLVLSLIVFVLFDRSPNAAGTIQFAEKLSWIQLINAHYFVGVDGLSLPFFILTTLLGFLVVLISWKIELRAKEYFVWILILQAAITGVFLSLDLLLFFVFWELELIPMYFLIAIWGTGRKEYSAIKYVLYTLLGGAFILAGILILFFATGSLDMTYLASINLGEVLKTGSLALTFIFFFLGFAIKLPVFPLHTWLPDAHTDAPTAVSVILAGTLLKMGGYAMIRICVAMFPDQAHNFAPVILGLAVVNVLYGGAITLKQTDIKRLIAFSSISHMGFVLLGIFALSQLSITGASLLMFSHGIITGLLFAVTGIIIHNTHERDLNKFGGLARQTPGVAVLFILGGLGAMAVPLTSGFISEVMVFLGSFSSKIIDARIFTLLCLLGLLLAAGYILWTIQRVFYGPPQERFNKIVDADKLERFYGTVFIAVVFLIGIFPTILTNVLTSGIAGIAAKFGG